MNALTKSFKSASGVLLLSGVAAASLLSSCANENIFSSENGKTVNITVNVVKPGFDDNTRTSLTENNGNLDCFWKSGDQIWVTNQDGGSVGYLTMMPEYDGKVNAKFTGSLTGMKDGKTTLKFYYLGTEKNAQAASGKQEFSFATQEGTIPSLSYNDLLMSEREVNVADGDAYTEELGLQRQFAFARFRLVMPAGVEVAGQTVTVSGENFFNVATLDPAGSITFTAGSATVKINSDNEFYMTILPETGKQITPTFTVTVGEKTYIGSLSAREWKKSEYVRMDLGNGSYQGIPIDMTEKQGGGDNPGPDYPGYENEDPRNPLHKWAKYNLERKDGVINGFVDSETENGALYQWGRNYGYMDKSGTYPGSNVRISGDFTNYFDAMGDYEWFDAFNNPATASTGYYRLFDYYVYNPNSAVVTSGTGLKGYSNGYQYWANIDNFKNYNTLEDLKAHQDKFFIDFGNQSLDYWIPSEFGNGGNTWEVRAEKCGYDRTNPCPDGWRIPTEADFKEICPSSLPSYQGNLSTLITQKAQPELREANNGTKYVIRWLNYTGYLKIEAIVVDNNFQESDIKAIVWDNNPMVVTRLFPFTGNISSFNASDTRLTSYLNQQITLVIPYVFGAITQSKMEAGDYYGFIWGYSPFYYPWTLFTPAENFGSAIGGYWANEKILFQFEDTSRSGGNLKSSCITIRSGNPELGYAIRPVMDK